MAKWSGKTRRFRTRDGMKRAESRYADGAQDRTNAAEARRQRRREKALRDAARGGIELVE
jgi:hypothetical protein